MPAVADAQPYYRLSFASDDANIVVAMAIIPSSTPYAGRTRNPAGWYWLGSWLLYFLLLSTGAQADNWRSYKAADGLSESYSTTICLNEGGRLWVRHGDSEKLSCFDGYDIFQVKAPVGAMFRVYETKTNQLLTLFNGGIASLRRGQWYYSPWPELQTELQSNMRYKVRPFPLLPGNPPRVLALFPDQLVEYNPFALTNANRTVLRASDTPLGRFLDMSQSRDGGIWVGGTHGLARIAGANRWGTDASSVSFFIPPNPSGLVNFQQPFEDDQGGVTMVADVSGQSERRVSYFDGTSWQQFKALDGKLRHAWRSSDGHFWAQSIDALGRVDADGRETPEIETTLAGQLFDVACAPRDVFFMATSEGILRHAPSSWRTPPRNPAINSGIYAMTESPDHSLWLAGASALFRLQNHKWDAFPYPADLEIRMQPTDIMGALPDGQILLNTGSRLLQFLPSEGRFASPTLPLANTAKIIGKTHLGQWVCAIQNTNIDHSVESLMLYDGHTFSPFIAQIPKWNDGNEVFFCHTRTNAGVTEIWLGGSEGVGVCRNGAWQFFDPANSEAPDAGYCMLELNDGRLWVGGAGSISQFDGQKWSLVRGGFDRIYQMTQTKSNDIWLATSDGIIRHWGNNWLLNGIEEGLPSMAVYEIFCDSENNHLWAGTARGPCHLDPEADLDPPHTSIASANSQNEFFVDAPITFTFSAQDRWKFTPPERLLYSYRRDNIQWTPFSPENTVTFRDLTPGAHRLAVRAMDRMGNVDTSDQAMLVYNVILPWYLETRLLYISFSALAVSLFFAAVAANRHRRLRRSYAEVEQIVTQRTKELEIANQALLQNQKMRALGTMAAGIAHDFNNILSIIKGSAQIIEAHPQDQEKIRTRVSRIKTVVDQGSTIVKALLGFSHSTEMKLAPSDINSILVEAVKLLADQFAPSMVFAIKPAQSLPQVPCAKDQLRQMLINLLINAAEAMGGEGKVELSSGLSRTPPHPLVLSPAHAPRYVWIAVRDHGCGMAADVQSRIFEPFFTTKAFSSRRGTGLGLSMVYEFAKDQSFGLEVESQLGQGSTFTIWMPLPESDTVTASTSATDSTRPAP